MKPKVWVRVVFFMIVFATVLHIAGLVSPLWIWLHTDDFHVGVGLYYRIGCGSGSGDNCTDTNFPTDIKFRYDSDATYDERSWVAVVWLETIAAALALILFIMMLVYMIGFGSWRKMSLLNVALTFVAILTWLPLLAGLILYSVEYRKVIIYSPDISTESFPWSLLMCYLAAVIFIIVTFLIRMRCKARNFIKHAIPAAADSKMALNPFTKNQIMKRYFTPSPYREERRQALYSSAYYTDQSHLLGNGFASGAIESSYDNNRALEDRAQTRGIEYNVVERQEMPTTRVIETNNLTTGTYVGGGAVTNTAVNNDFKGTIFERDLGASVRRNDDENVGTRVVERTYITRTAGGGNYGNVDKQVGRHYLNTQVQPSETTTEVVRQARWQTAQQEMIQRGGGVQEERIVGRETTLNKHGGYDAFSDIDAETIYYTGQEGYTPSGFIGRRDEFVTQANTRDVAYSKVIQNEERRRDFSNNYGVVTKQIIQAPAAAPPPPPPPAPVPEETVVREITIYEREAGGQSQPAAIQHFRLGADQQAVKGIKQAQTYTVHTRTDLQEQNMEQVHLAPGQLDPGQLQGDKFKYNGTYIYRPYSEETY